MSASQHVELPGSARPAVADAARVGDVDPSRPVTLTLTLRGPALPDADHLPSAGLTAEEFAQTYGADPADAEKVAATMTGYGFTVDDVSLPARTMHVSGTIGQMQSAFRPQLALFKGTSGEFRGREGSLSVPAELDGVLTGVFGVDERRVVKPRSAPAASAPVGLMPADLTQRYRFPAGDGGGQKIAIAEFGGGCFREDITAYCAMVGVADADPQVTTVPLGHPAYTLAQILALPDEQEREDELGAAGEVMMDIEIVAGLCPGADILVYFAPFSEQGWVDLLTRALADRPVSLSISWGSAEGASIWSHSALTTIDGLLNSLAVQGVTVCVSSGDDGSGDVMFDGRAHVDFPASSAFTLGVGGTKIVDGVEQVWWDKPGTRFTSSGKRTGGGATGGGVSEKFTRPAWQAVTVASVNHGHPIDGRVVPDVAALAGAPYYQLVFRGKPGPNGGTSASAPLWASLIARVQAGLPLAAGQRFLTPLLHRAGAAGTAVCQDIATGHDNASSPDPGRGYAPAPGYDAATGWGVPDGEALLKLLGS